MVCAMVFAYLCLSSGQHVKVSNKIFFMPEDVKLSSDDYTDVRRSHHFSMDAKQKQQ